MHLISKLTIATAGVAFFTIGANLAPAKAALLDFRFSTTDVFQNGNIETGSGSFRLDTQTRQVSNFGGILMPVNTPPFSSSFNVLVGDPTIGTTVLVVTTTSCFAPSGIPQPGQPICLGTNIIPREVGLEFNTTSLLYQLSSEPSIYASSFVPGTRPGPIGPGIENLFNVRGSQARTFVNTSRIPSPITTLQVETVESVAAVPEPSTTTAILAFAALSSTSWLLRKQAKN
jgi:hypothetical protein